MRAPIGLLVDGGGVICLPCAEADRETGEPVTRTGYPDGFTCPVCGDLIA